MSRIVIWADKHGDHLYDASTDEKWAAASLDILRQWLDDGYLSDGDDPDGEIREAVETNDRSMHTGPVKSRPRAWLMVQAFSVGEYMDVRLETLIDATKDN